MSCSFLLLAAHDWSLTDTFCDLRHFPPPPSAQFPRHCSSVYLRCSAHATVADRYKRHFSPNKLNSCFLHCEIYRTTKAKQALIKGSLNTIQYNTSTTISWQSVQRTRVVLKAAQPSGQNLTDVSCILYTVDCFMYTVYCRLYHVYCIQPQ